jgi:hypothetical protein
MKLLMLTILSAALTSCATPADKCRENVFVQKEASEEITMVPYHSLFKSFERCVRAESRQ